MDKKPDRHANAGVKTELKKKRVLFKAAKNRKVIKDAQLLKRNSILPPRLH